MDDKEYREKLKRAHICPGCKAQDAYTLAGRTYCFDCTEKRRIQRQAAWADPVKKAKMLLQSRERQERYKAENKCLQCGKQLHNGERLCGICREKARRAVRKSRGRTPRNPGVICWQCNKQPCMDGKRLCQSCYEKKVKAVCGNLKKADRENHPWRKLSLKNG